MTTPNPTLSLSSIDGTTRTLDDWTTVFRQLWVVLPSKAEASTFIPVAEQIFKTFGDSDARCAYLIPGNETVAKKILSMTNMKTQCFVDPEFSVCEGLGITQAPSLVYIRQDSTVTHSVQGFDCAKWTQAVEEIAKTLRWTAPELDQFASIPSQSYLIQ